MGSLMDPVEVDSNVEDEDKLVATREFDRA